MVSLTGPMSTIFQRSPPAAPADVWTLRASGITGSPFNIQQQLAFGAGTWVALFDNDGIPPFNSRESTSPDGLSWTASSMGLAASTFTDVIFGGGQFVATAGTDVSATRIATSPDGFTWTSRTSAFVAAFTREKVLAYNGSLYVIGGQQQFSTFCIQTSPDGITWTARDGTIAAGGASIILGLSFGSGIFVAISSANEFATSPDGITWTTQVSPFSFGGPYSVFHNGTFFVACSSAEIATSPDGITWTLQVFPFTADSFTAVGFGNGLWLVVGGATVFTSPDGITWTDNSPTLLDPLDIFLGAIGVFFANGLYVVIGIDGTGSITFATASLIP